MTAAEVRLAMPAIARTEIVNDGDEVGIGRGPISRTSNDQGVPAT
jgi:hypothetical protein